jgi:hypothetical protein
LDGIFNFKYDMIRKNSDGISIIPLL